MIAVIAAIPEKIVVAVKSVMTNFLNIVLFLLFGLRLDLRF